MVWSLIDYFARSGFFPQYELLFIKAIIIAFPVMVVQFHLFTSYFFAQGQGRWLPFAYGSLAGIIAIVVFGLVPESVILSGDRLRPVYGIWIIAIALPLLVLAVRNLSIFWKAGEKSISAFTYQNDWHTLRCFLGGQIVKHA